MSVLKKLASDAVIYGLSTILGRVLNYILVPLYTSAAVMSVSEFGIQAELYAYVAFLNIIYTYGMETTFFRFATKSNPVSTFNQVVTSLLCSTFLLSILIFISANPLANAMGYAGHGEYLLYLAGVLALDTLSAIPLARLRLQNKAFRFACIKLANVGLNLFLNLFFLLFCRKVMEGDWLVSWQPFISSIYDPEIGVGYIFISNLIASSLQILLLLPAYFRFKPEFKWLSFKPMLMYAYPLVFTGLAGMINEVLDRFLLKYYLSDDYYVQFSSQEAMAVYAACYKLSIFMSITVQAFKYAAEPFFFSQSADKQAPRLFARVMYYFIITGVSIWVLVSLNLGLIQRIFLRDPTYWFGVGAVPILLLANLFLGIYYNLAVWFKITDRTYYGLWISLIGAGITLIANFILIPIFGFYGSAWATLMAYFSMSCLCYYWGQQFFSIPYDLKHMFKYFLLGSFFIMISWLLPLKDFWLKAGANFFLCIVFLGMVAILERKPKLKK